MTEECSSTKRVISMPLIIEPFLCSLWLFKYYTGGLGVFFKTEPECKNKCVLACADALAAL